MRLIVIDIVTATCSASSLAAWLLGWFVAGCYADKKEDRDLPVGPFTITGSDPYPVCAGYCMDKVCKLFISGVVTCKTFFLIAVTRLSHFFFVLGAHKLV